MGALPLAVGRGVLLVWRGLFVSVVADQDELCWSLQRAGLDCYGPESTGHDDVNVVREAEGQGELTPSPQPF